MLARVSRNDLHSAFVSDVEMVEAGLAVGPSSISKLATGPQTGFDAKLADWIAKVNALLQTGRGGSSHRTEHAAPMRGRPT